MVDTHHTMVTDTAIGECIVRPTLTMVVRGTMAVGTGVGVIIEKRLTAASRAPARFTVAGH
jgi:hypothetical protein